MEYIKSTELGYNYLRDRLILNSRPLDFFMDSAFTEVDFNLENIINMRPQVENTDSNKIILDSNNLKENSEFDLKSKEKK